MPASSMLSPVILVAGIFALVDSVADPTNEAVRYILEKSGRSSMALGFGASLGWLYFATSFLVILAFLLVASRLVFYAGERQ